VIEMMRRVMHVDLDAFFVSVERVRAPALKGKPVVVGGRPGGRGVVASASYEARAFGLHSGMPLATASRLCPQAVFIEGNFARYREASKGFMAILTDFSPFLEPGGLDEAYLEATGFESLYGSIRGMALAIKKRVREELGLPASIGIAGCKVVAKVASDESKPDGLIEVASGGDAAYLAPLPLGKLPGIGRKTEPVLRGMGVATIGELATMPVTMLKSRFGVSGEHLLRLARAVDDRKIVPPSEARSISRETTFARDSRDQEFLLATLSYLSERVGADLRRHERQARCVALKLRYADFTTITRQNTLKPASDAYQDIFDAGEKLLRGELKNSRQAIRLIGIGVSNLVLPAQQLSMLDGRSERLARLDGAVDRIRDKYGFSAVTTGRTLKLKDIFSKGDDGYTLNTPSLSR